MEIWRDIKSFENLYQVSRQGDVWSIRKQRLLKPAIQTGGYLMVSLSRNGKGSSKLIHRLVVESFVGEIAIGMEVNHINGIKIDNRLENLEVVTHTQNVNHNYQRLGVQMPKGSHHWKSKLNEQDIIEILELAKKGMTRTMIGCQFNVSRDAIDDIVNGRTWKHIQECE